MDALLWTENFWGAEHPAQPSKGDFLVLRWDQQHEQMEGISLGFVVKNKPSPWLSPHFPGTVGLPKIKTLLHFPLTPRYFA